MRIYGLDFTSAPKKGKPITVAECDLDGDRLAVVALLRFADLGRFERSLRQDGPWVAGMDFPFSQPRRLVRDLGWPDDWESLVRHVAALEPGSFADLLDLYRKSRPMGDREHKRRTDVRAKSLSPMKLYFVPLARMFYAGAPRLLASGVSVLPCRPNGDPRVVVESYPALVARALVGRRSYKSDQKRKQTAALEAARRELVAALAGDAIERRYGLRVDAGPHLRALVDDASGDLLDAVLAAVQAAWASGRRDEGWGIPDGCDPLEGWIVDPETLSRELEEAP